jgi:hypothetical protein
MTPIIHRLSLLTTLAACSPAPQTSVMPAPSGVACLTGQESMIRDALTFGLSIPGGGMVSDSAWDAFLAERVTPAFPSGFTVLSANGQWREATGVVAREPSRVIVVIHPPSHGADSSLAGIRSEYMRRFRQEAVMWERTSACVGF